MGSWLVTALAAAVAVALVGTFLLLRDRRSTTNLRTPEGAASLSVSLVSGAASTGPLVTAVAEAAAMDSPYAVRIKDYITVRSRRAEQDDVASEHHTHATESHGITLWLTADQQHADSLESHTYRSLGTLLDLRRSDVDRDVSVQPLHNWSAFVQDSDVDAIVQRWMPLLEPDVPSDADVVVDDATQDGAIAELAALIDRARRLREAIDAQLTGNPEVVGSTSLQDQLQAIGLAGLLRALDAGWVSATAVDTALSTLDAKLADFSSSELGISVRRRVQAMRMHVGAVAWRDVVHQLDSAITDAEQVRTRVGAELEQQWQSAVDQAHDDAAEALRRRRSQVSAVAAQCAQELADAAAINASEAEQLLARVWKSIQSRRVAGSGRTTRALRRQWRQRADAVAADGYPTAALLALALVAPSFDAEVLAWVEARQTRRTQTLAAMDHALAAALRSALVERERLAAGVAARRTALNGEAAGAVAGAAQTLQRELARGAELGGGGLALISGR